MKTAKSDPALIDPAAAYQNLEQRFHKAALYEEAYGISAWDMQVMMPPGAADKRADVLEMLTTERHKLLTAPDVGAWLDQAERSPPSDPWAARNLQLMRRQYIHATALSADLVGRNTQACARAENAWAEQKNKDKKNPGSGDFNSLLPLLKEIVACQREIARVKGKALGVLPYEALMDQYEPGWKVADIESRLFQPLEKFLSGAIPAIEARQASLPTPIRLKPVSEQNQAKFIHHIVKQMGFDFTRGRIDKSTHPFCGGANDDVRLTTRYNENDPLSAVFGIVHETGHGLYEQNRPGRYLRQPVGAALGMGAHESQSLAQEMDAAHTPAFIRWMSQELANFWPYDMAYADADNLLRLMNKVQRSPVRVEADEVTYPLHVILRFRLEQDLIDGRLEVEDLPKRWAADMQRYLGIAPPSDGLGWAQDTHWFGGAFGYFPSYSMGKLAAEQLGAKARQDVPGIDAALGQGNFGPLVGWMKANVHEQGSLYPTLDELLLKSTGAVLSPDAYMRKIAATYLPGQTPPQPAGNGLPSANGLPPANGLTPG